ncbi:type II toxin-antitoxin system prevent-host-death family antitoxin [Actinoplanes sp. NPDC049596]|uniref:type II toxin-antitoxin system Phd/YefM family antitoxin n=1 Tax=unclassified Actinoplanes TaxID=2626549 RepID=UPI0034428E17
MVDEEPARRFLVDHVLNARTSIARAVPYSARLSRGIVTAAISAGEARKNLFFLIERVNADHAPIEIVSRRGNAILVSQEDWDAMVETNYLLSSPANATWLAESVEQWRAGRATED